MLMTFCNLMHKFVKQMPHNCFVFLAVLLKFVMAFIYSHLSMPGGQFSHFRHRMSLARDTGHRGLIRDDPGHSRDG